MKTELMTTIKTVSSKITSAVKSKGSQELVKDGEKLISSAQDATAAQGKAMVKPYVKPEIKNVNLDKKNLKAASGGEIPFHPSSPDVTPPGGPGLGYWIDKIGDLWT
ncbi:MAG: hypothetical protein NC200_06980 [Candidatus Gastranaerophilales bacterium]|nr:hypothetical protein [Candidatus Gastranaerophilales bacterium]